MKLKTLALLVGGAAAAAMISPSTGAFAGSHTRAYSGEQYCAVHVGDNWSLVGGASCNLTPDHANANSRWADSYIVDFEHQTVATVTGSGAAAGDFGSLSPADFMTQLNGTIANPGWMYVGNIRGNGEHVYLQVKCASGKKTPWDIQGVCTPA